MKKLPGLLFLTALMLVLFVGCQQPSSSKTGTPTATPVPPAPASLLARTGRGALNQAVYSADSKYILAAFGTGVSSLCSCNMTEIGFYTLPDGPRSLVFFPDGLEVAVGTAQGQVLFLQFDPATGLLTPGSRPALSARQASNVAKDLFEIQQINLSPDGRYLAAVSKGFQMQVWDLENGQALLKQPQYGSVDFAFSSNSRYLLANVYLLDLQSAQVIWQFEGGSLAFLPDGEHIANAYDLNVSRKSSVYTIFDIATRQTVKTLQLAESPEEEPSLYFSPDGEYVLEAFSIHPTFSLYRAATGELVKTFSSQAEWMEFFYSFSVSDEGLVAGLVPYLVPGDNTYRVHPFIIDLTQDPPLAFTIDFNMPVNFTGNLQPVFSPNEQLFLYFENDWLAQAEPSTRQVGYLMDNIPVGTVTSLAFAPDGGTLAIGKDPPSLSLYDLVKTYSRQTINPAGQNLPVSRHTPAGLSGLSYLPDGKNLAFITSPGWLSIWPLADKDPQPPIKPVESALELFGLAVAPDGHSLAVGGYERAVRLWNDPLGKTHTSQLLEDSSPVSALAYTPDGKILAAGTAKGFIRLWDPSSGKLLRTLKGHTGWVGGLAFTPAGDRLVSISLDGTVWFWKVADGSQERRLELGRPGTSLALDSYGQVLALGVQDGRAYLWDLKSQAWLGALGDGASGISVLAFSADGSRLALGLENGQSQIWQVRDGAGKLAGLPQVQPSAAPQTSVCQISPGSPFINEQLAQAAFQVGKEYELTWQVPYHGDCSGLAVPDGAVQLGSVSASDFRFEDLGGQLLQVTANVAIPMQTGQVDASWKLTLAGADFTLAARLTTLDQPGLVALPAPLYYLDHGAILRLETDGLTRSQVVEAPVQCMDVSPVDGSLAYLHDDELILADAHGGGRRTLLPVAGCPSWSTDGKSIAYTLNGVKLFKLADGQVTTLRDDLNANDKTRRVYTEILDWSPFSNKFVARSSGHESLTNVVFDVTTAYRTGLPGSGDVAWSRNGEYVYEGQAQYGCYFSSPPHLTRTNVVTDQTETLLGGSDADLRGALAPFETGDGTLLFFGSRLAATPCEADQPVSKNLTPARMTPGSSTPVQYDDSQVFENIQSVLWGQAGSLALLSLGDQNSQHPAFAVVIARPFSSLPPVFLAVDGANLRWGLKP